MTEMLQILLVSAACLQNVVCTVYVYIGGWRFGNALALINVVALRQTRLVARWVTVCGRVNHRYVTSQLGPLSLLPSVGK